MRTTGLVLAILLAVAAPAHAGRRGKVIDRVAIVVDGEPIFESDIVRRAHFAASRAGAETELIDEALVVGYARVHSVTVDPGDVDLAIEEIKKQNEIGDAELAAALKEQGITLAEYRVEVERQILLIRTRNVIMVDVPFEEHEAKMAEWIEQQRARAFVDRRVAK